MRTMYIGYYQNLSPAVPSPSEDQLEHKGVCVLPNFYTFSAAEKHLVLGVKFS